MFLYQNSKRLDNMVVRKVDIEKDFSKIEKFLAHFKKKENLPENLFCAEIDREIVAIAGLRKVEGGFGLFDSFSTDSKFSSQERNEALVKLLHQLHIVADELKMKAIFAFTKERSILTRASHIGFNVLPHTVISKELLWDL